MLACESLSVKLKYFLFIEIIWTSSINYYKVYLVSYITDETKPVNAMDRKVDIQHNNLMQLKNSMLMYGVYNVETLEKLIITVHNIHNTI